MTEREDRDLIESRYGALGSGAPTVIVRDTAYSISDLLMRMGLNFDDSRPIDVAMLSDDRYVFRYYDGQDQRVVAVEFDGSFNPLGEIRARFPEWLGDDECYPQYCGH
jgi:hypothetical protein